MKLRSLLLVLFSSFVLVACGGLNEQAQTYMNAGDTAMADEDYDKAIKNYSNAYNADPKDEILGKLRTARENKYNLLTSELGEFKSTYYNQEALDTLNLMLKDYAEFIDEETLEGYETERKDLEKLAKAQAELDAYIKEIKPHYLELRAIANEWNTLSFTINLGNFNKSKTDQDIANLAVRNKSVQNALDQMQFNVPPAIATIHSQLFNTSSAMDHILSSALGALRSNSPASAITQEGQQSVSNIQIEIANFMTQINNYATDKNLRDTFKEYIVGVDNGTEESVEEETTEEGK